MRARRNAECEGGKSMKEKFHYVIWDEEKNRLFWEFYGAIPAKEETHYSAIAARDIVLKASKLIPKGSKVLDIGIGGGHLLKALYCAQYKCYGIDVSKQNVKHIHQLCERERLGIKVKLGSISNMPYDDEVFNGVFCIEVLEHLLDKELKKGIKELYRVLKYGGYTIVTVPYREKLERNLVMCPDCGAVFHSTQHLKSFDENSLNSLFTNAAFQVVHCSPKAFGNMYLKSRIIRLAQCLRLLHVQPESLLLIARK